MTSTEPNLATLAQLESEYDITDLFNFLEILEVKEELMEIAQEEAKAEQARIKQQTADKKAKGR